jgi:hypothetical protein
MALPNKSAAATPMTMCLLACMMPSIANAKVAWLE